MLNDLYMKPTSRRHQAISLLLANDPRLLDLAFTADRKSLSGTPEELLAFCAGFSSGQKILVRVALEIMGEPGDVSLRDIISKLDEVRFEGFMLALECLRFSRRFN